MPASQQIIPTNVSDVTQELWEKYMKEVKALLYQRNFKQELITTDSLEAVEEFEIISIPQNNGGILVQLRAKTGSLTELLQQVQQLSPSDWQLLKSYINS